MFQLPYKLILMLVALTGISECDIDWNLNDKNTYEKWKLYLKDQIGDACFNKFEPDLDDCDRKCGNAFIKSGGVDDMMKMPDMNGDPNKMFGDQKTKMMQTMCCFVWYMTDCTGPRITICDKKAQNTYKSIMETGDAFCSKYQRSQCKYSYDGSKDSKDPDNHKDPDNKKDNKGNGNGSFLITSNMFLTIILLIFSLY